MKCEEIQPNLLDYGRGRLNGRESEEIGAHLRKCTECAAVLEDELALYSQLASLPGEEPLNDVWTLVRARTRPKRFAPLARLSEMVMVSRLRRAAAAVAATAVVAITVYGLQPEPPKPAVVKNPVPAPVVVKWSDDPLGSHTDAMVEFIDSM